MPKFQMEVNVIHCYDVEVEADNLEAAKELFEDDPSWYDSTETFVDYLLVWEKEDE